MLGSVTGLPGWHPPRSVLELAELVLSGALDRSPAGLQAPAELSGAAGVAGVVLEDAEGTPVAVLRPAGERLEPLRHFTHGPLRAARRDPVAVREAWPEGASVLAVPVPADRFPTAGRVRDLMARARADGSSLLWLAVFGAGRPAALPPEGLWRAVGAVAASAAEQGVPSVAVPVAVPAPGTEGTGDEPDADLLARVARGYGATTVEAVEAVEAGEAVEAEPHPAFVVERDRAVRPPYRRGVTVFFTGLSGSGKSTLAKALAEQVTERSRRTVSLLDGDEVRRLLSAGLGFGRADRDLNIRRIGFVATEVCRHGGMAVCAPIAPFAATRDQVRADVEAVGDLVLVHVSTPLAECERRDRKGLYARARAGEIPEFTGISSPYEVPVDADLRIDTSRLSVAEGVALLWDLLAARGYLGPVD